MLHLIVPLVATGFHVGKSPWGIVVLVALAALAYWFVRRRRDRRDRDRDRDRNQDRNQDDR